jgi:hypothetical protein
MVSLNLGEAAEKSGTSKVEIWRAIREGRLSAQRTDDGGFAIEPAELFRVFEAREQPATEEDAMAATEMNDIAVAFATLGAELRGILGLSVKERADTEPRQHDAEGPGVDLTERNAQLAAELAAVQATAERAIAEYASLAEQQTAIAGARRPWWRRLVG